MELKKPIGESGEPTLYACIIMSLADGKLYTKEQILNKIYTSDNMNNINMNGYLSKVFSILGKHKIIENRKGRYTGAENYDAYLGFILKELYCNSKYSDKIINIFKKYDMNSMDFIMKE